MDRSRARSAFVTGFVAETETARPAAFPLNPSGRLSFFSVAGGLELDEKPLSELSDLYLRLATLIRAQVGSPEALIASRNPDRSAEGCIFLAMENSLALLLCVLACVAGGLRFTIVGPERFRRAGSQFNSASFAPTPIVVISKRVDIHATERDSASVISVEDLLEMATAVPPSLPVNVPDDAVLYFQLTSGSSGFPRAVPVTRGMLRKHIAEIAKHCGLSSSDRAVHWVPLFHDMGLVNFLMTLSLGGSALMLEPASFIRNPLSWLKHLSDFRATLTAVPNFALRITERLGRIRSAGLDLRSLRRIWVSAEPVFPETVAAFTKTFTKVGLPADIVRPAYGMAEAVVGVATTRPDRPVRVLEVEVHSMALGSPIRLIPTCSPLAIGEPRADEKSQAIGVSYISNGTPLANIGLEIRSAGKVALPELHLGRIMIRGETVARAYAGCEEDLEDGWRDTGDVGFLHAGELFVVGRRKDIIIRGGINYAAEDIERAAEGSLGREIRRVAAISVINHRAGKEQLLVLCETRKERPDLQEVVTASLVKALGIAPDFVFRVPPGAIPLTSSGKIRRQELRETYAKSDDIIASL